MPSDDLLCTVALLMFQLAIGLQWQTVQAIVSQPEQQMDGMEAGHGPTHSSKDLAKEGSDRCNVRGIASAAVLLCYVGDHGGRDV
jgi:hypothetical protein